MPAFTRSYYIKQTLQADRTYLRQELPYPVDETTPRVPQKSPEQEKEDNMMYQGSLGSKDNSGIDFTNQGNANSGGNDMNNQSNINNQGNTNNGGVDPSAHGVNQTHTQTNTEPTAEDAMDEKFSEAIQCPYFRKLMEKAMDLDREKHFMDLAQKGLKLPRDFDVNQLKAPEVEESTLDIMNKQFKAFQMQLDSIKQSRTPKPFSIEALCPFPFDKSLVMVPFSINVVFPKYDKYEGTMDPQDHLQEFCALSLEFMHDTTYLMRLFPRSLGGMAMEWFSKLPSRIKTFEELASKFMAHYSYNIKHDVTMIMLCNTKQKDGEAFLTFLQRWRTVFARYPRSVPEKEKMDIFINSLSNELNYRLRMQCPKTFQDLIENGVTTEEVLVKSGELKLYKDNKNNPNSGNNGNNGNNQKDHWFNSNSRYKNNNKGIVNDGVVESSNLKVVPFALTRTPNQVNNTNQSSNAPSNNNHTNNGNQGDNSRNTKFDKHLRPTPSKNFTLG